MIDRLPDTLRRAAALREALEEGRLNLVYQPKIDLGSGRLAGVEALTRWHTSQRGSMEPSLFIPVAEKAGLIGALTEWGLKTCIEQWILWRGSGLDTNIAFNISPLILDDIHFPDRVRALCERAGMPPGRLTLELTEGATQDPVRLMDTLTRFRIMGMHVSLDDFGTGYSSLLLLRQLPFTEVKIDKRFVEEAVHSQDARIIIESIVSLGHNLGLTATAEGVDSQESPTLVRALGCDLAQGYFVSRPLAGEMLARFRHDLAARQLS